METAGVELVVLGPSNALRWVTGYRAMALERLTALLVTRTDAVMVLPGFDAEEFAETSGLDGVLAWSDREGPGDAVVQAFARLGIGGPGHGSVLVDDELPYGFFARLEPHLPGPPARATELLGGLRQVKDGGEIGLLERAGEVVSIAMDAALESARPGMTELELQRRIEQALMEAGADGAEYVLVQGGTASAVAHHVAGSRPLQAGEPVLVDIATPTAGYFADMTQQVFLGEPPEDYRCAYAAVLAAEEAGVQAAQPGATAADVASAAQAVIAEAGFAEYAGGRIGHGIGLDVHEPPNIIEWDATALTAGTVITVEPGIYIPGRFGIRIEDTIVVTEDGPRRLTRAPRALTISRV